MTTATRVKAYLNVEVHLSNGLIHVIHITNVNPYVKASGINLLAWSILMLTPYYKYQYEIYSGLLSV